jgi:hypothetical protein
LIISTLENNLKIFLKKFAKSNKGCIFTPDLKTNKMKAIINREQNFGTLNGVITKNDEIRKVVNQHLKQGTAKLLIDTEETLIYELGEQKPNSIFPTHPIELHKMFKETGLAVMNPEMETGLFMVKIHASKVKHKSDLENAFTKIQKVANKYGFTTKLKRMQSDFSDFSFHGNYYNIFFYAE